MKNILILGVCGFMGTFLRKRLQPEYNVIGYDRIEPADDDIASGGSYKHICGNFANDDFCKILLENNVDAVFHLISSTVPIDGTEAVEGEITQDVLPTVRLLGDMAQAGVKRLIFASSGGTVYGQSSGTGHKVTDRLSPVCSHGIQKSTIEDYISLYNYYHGLSGISARIANPYGVWVDDNRTQGVIPLFIRNLLNNKEIIVYGDTARDYIHIDDVSGALHRLIDYTGEQHIFNIGTGQSHYLSEVIKIIEKTAGRKFNDIKYREIRKHDVTESVLDISETVNELKWKPKYDIESGIREILSQFTGMSDITA